MPKPLSPSLPFPTRPFALAAVAVGATLLAVALALWVHYGTAVFYEMILSGIAACL